MMNSNTQTKLKDKMVLLCTKDSKFGTGNFHSDSFETNGERLKMFYSGQAMGRYDHTLEDAVNRELEFTVYFRSKNNMPFSFIGVTKHVQIIRHRQCEKNTYAAEDERLLLGLTFAQYNDPSGPMAKVMEVFKYDGRYKFDVLYELNAIDRLGNQTCPFNKNKNLGFYLIPFETKYQATTTRENGLVYNYCQGCGYFRHGHSDEFSIHYCFHCWGTYSWGGRIEFTI